MGNPWRDRLRIEFKLGERDASVVVVDDGDVFQTVEQLAKALRCDAERLGGDRFVNVDAGHDYSLVRINREHAVLPYEGPLTLSISLDDRRRGVLRALRDAARSLLALYAAQAALEAGCAGRLEEAKR